MNKIYLEAMRMTKLDVIDKVVETYAVDKVPRSVCFDGSCVYENGGAGCAFKLFCKPEINLSLFENKGAEYVLKSFGFNILKDEVQHITDLDFWLDIQDLHDHNPYWDENQYLTEEGEKFVQELKKRYSE